MIDFAGDGVTWSSFFYSPRSCCRAQGSKWKARRRQNAELGWTEDRQWHHPERGFRFEPKETFVRAWSLGEVIAYGIEETQNSLLMVFKFLGKVGTRQVSARSVGGADHDRRNRLSLRLVAVLRPADLPLRDRRQPCGNQLSADPQARWGTHGFSGLRGHPPQAAERKVQIGLSYMGLSCLWHRWSGSSDLIWGSFRDDKKARF